MFFSSNNNNYKRNYLQLPFIIFTNRAKSLCTGGWNRIFDFSNGQNADNFHLSTNLENKLAYEIRTGSGPYNVNPSLVTNDNTWRHFVWTISTDGTWKMYVNGVLYQTDSKVVLPRVLRANAWLGKSAWPDPSYNGNIDDFRIYNTVLDADDIANLYQYTGSGSAAPGDNIITIIIINTLY